MHDRKALVHVGIIVLALGIACSCCLADGQGDRPKKVYIPYEKLKDVFESEKQGVFLPYDEFRRLWSSARGAPAGVAEAPVPYLISIARFTCRGRRGGRQVHRR